jgi:hypothetical protein
LDLEGFLEIDEISWMPKCIITNKRKEKEAYDE